MTTKHPHTTCLRPLGCLLGLVLALLTAAAATTSSPATATATKVSVSSYRIAYTSHDGVVRHAVVLLPSWYTPSHNPPLPLVISPHGRAAMGDYNAQFWGTLPTIGGFAVINPDGMGRVYARYSYGYEGQIDDLAQMPSLLCRAMPWVRIDRTRIFALGSSMGGQETLLLVARYHELLAGAAALDSVTDLPRRFTQLTDAGLRRYMQTEVGGRPGDCPSAYAARSPLSLAHEIAASGVPLQIWWSTKDRIVIDQKHQSAALFETLQRLGTHAPLEAVVGQWRHSSEMRSTALLPLALIRFGLLPAHFQDCPPEVQQISA